MIASPLINFEIEPSKLTYSKGRGNPTVSSSRMIELYQNIAKIYTAIARNDKIPYYQGFLYFFVRSLDVSGSGIATFDVAMLARSCNRTISTIKKSLRLARKLGLFRQATLTGMTARVSYTSLTKVCLMFDIKQLGSAYELYPSELDKMRIYNTRSIVADKQAQSIHMANKTAKEECKPRIVPPSEIFEGASVDWRGVTVFKGRERDLLLADARFTVYGASQASIGETLQRSRHTITRHLRAIKGLDRVERYQLLKLSEDEINSADFWDKHPTEHYSYCFVKGNLYRRCCNIYNLDRSGLKQRAARARILYAHGELDVDWAKGYAKSKKKRDSINK